jgi:hypothetical protein
MDGWCYLHTNGDLIFKRTKPEIEYGGFVRRVWPLDVINRMTCWFIVVEAKAMGAREQRILELANKWGCTDEDAHEFTKRLKLLLERDGSSWCCKFQDFVNLQESPAGFGDTCIEAIANLIVEAGGVPNLENSELVI